MNKALGYLQEAEKEMEACKCSEERKKLFPSDSELRKENIRITEINNSLRDKIKDKEKLIEEKEESIKEKKEQLENKEKKINAKEDELKTKDKKIDDKQAKLDEVNKDFSNLRVEDQRTIDENNHLREKVKELQQYKLRSQEEKFQRLIIRRGADEEEIEKLCKAYEKLNRTQKKEE